MRVGRLSLIKSRPEDAEAIADSLRFFDKRECMIWGFTPLEALTEPFAIDGARNGSSVLFIKSVNAFV